MSCNKQTCQLCGISGLDINKGGGDELEETDHIAAFKFLFGEEISAEKEIKEGKVFVCQNCSAKIRLISSLRSESVKSKNESKEGESTKHEKTSSIEEENVDFEELNQLSLFYAEHDNVEKDPDFAPTVIKKTYKRPSKRPAKYISESTTPPKISLQHPREAKIVCQLCIDDHQYFPNIESLRNHFVKIHDYKEEKNSSESNSSDFLHISCHLCSTELLSSQKYMSHVLCQHSDPFVGSSSSLKTLTPVKLFKCETCQRKFRRKTTYESHVKNCFQVFTDNGSIDSECKICGKVILSSRLAAHRSFEHICRICDDQVIFANRKEKCQHLEIVHKLWSKGRAKKTINEISCPIEGCLQKFNRGSRKLKSHIKRDHEDSDGPKRSFKCNECHGLFKSNACLRIHMQTIHAANDGRIKCPFCEFSVGKWRKHSLYSHHIPALHPEKAKDFIKEQTIKRRLWKEDYANRSKIQCFICDYAGSKASHLKRHYTEVHGYDLSKESENDNPDPDDPDGALCPECGEHFVNKITLIRHLLKEHSCPKGEQCLYCPNRYLDIPSHVNKIHPEQKDSLGQLCKKCGENSSTFDSFESLLKHTRRHHRKVVGDINHLKSDIDIDKPEIMQPKVTNKKKKRQDSKKVIKSKSTSPKLNLDEENGKSVPKESQKTLENDANFNEESMDGFGGPSSGKRKKYVPQHLSGICPFCELKFSDLLGHIRHKGHEQSDSNSVEDRKKQCSLCQETFNSVRELVTHRQLHPQFKNHTCTKCGSEFETVVLLRNHRANNCPKNKKKKKKKAPVHTQEIKSHRQDSVPKISASSQEDSACNTNLDSIKAKDKQSSTSNLSTLLMMVNDLNTADPKNLTDEEPKPKPIEYEGRGTVKCHICLKSFTIKSLLRRHYISHHQYNPDKVQESIHGNENSFSQESEMSCSDCKKSFKNIHARIKHQLDIHSIISGEICPYCDCKWGWKKFDNLDEHVTKYHSFEMDSPIQSCLTCKTNFESYAALKKHRQLHEGNRRLIEINTANGKEKELVTIHTRVGMRPEVENRGGVKCMLCTSFKLRKDQLKIHYVKEHGYIPKLAEGNDEVTKTSQKIEDVDKDATFLGEEELNQGIVECNICPETFSNHHALIKHLLKSHCSYTGLICPYCRDSHHPQRFIDLQAHVMNAHMDQLTGYGVSNECKLCKKTFTGYAELRDHVQIHGDMFREPAPNKELYKENARRKRQEKRIDRQKQRQLATRQNVFEAAKIIFDNVNNPKLTILRKVTNEELSLNNIKRLSTGQIVIEDPSLLAKSIIHQDSIKNGTNKQLMVPIQLQDKKTANIGKQSHPIDIQECSTPPQTTEQVNFEDEMLENDFGSIKMTSFPYEAMYPTKDPDNPLKKSNIHNDMINQREVTKKLKRPPTSYLDNNVLSAIIPECPPPSPNTPPDETGRDERTDNASSNVDSEILEEDEGQIGIVVVNNDTKYSNSSFKKASESGKSNCGPPLRVINNLADILPLNNSLGGNVLRIIKYLKTTKQNKNQISDTSTTCVQSKKSYIISRGPGNNTVTPLLNVRQRKKDLVLSSNLNTGVFQKLKERQKYATEHPKFDTNLGNEIENGINTSSSTSTAAEKFQEVSSPYSVAALLAAAELDEELSSHGDEQN